MRAIRNILERDDEFQRNCSNSCKAYIPSEVAVVSVTPCSLEHLHAVLLRAGRVDTRRIR